VGGWDRGKGFIGFDLIELGVQDVLDALVGVDPHGKGAATGRLETLLAGITPGNLHAEEFGDDPVGRESL